MSATKGLEQRPFGPLSRTIPPPYQCYLTSARRSAAMIKGRNRQATNELGELVERCRSVLWRAAIRTSAARHE